ncbi:MAG: zinc-binding dehydrogenase, partial [Planctomycetota bacterium]
SRGKIEIDPRATMTKDTTILGMSLNNLTLEEQARIQPLLVEGLVNGPLRPLVGREFPLAQAAAAHEAVLAPGSRGKIVLVP